MTTTQIKLEIQNIDAQIPDLELWHDSLDQARKALLINGDDKDRNVLSAIETGLPSGELITIHDPEVRSLLDGWNGRGLRSIEQDLADLRERRELLEGELPSDKEVAEAEEKASELSNLLSEQSALFNQCWSEFMTALAEAEGVARKMMVARSEAQATVVELSQLREQYALNLDLPKDLKPTFAEANTAGLAGTLLRDIGYSQVTDRSLEIELARARDQVEQAAA